MKMVQSFLEDWKSIAHLIEVFKTLPLFLGPKPNQTNWETVGIGSLKGAQFPVCGLNLLN